MFAKLKQEYDIEIKKTEHEIKEIENQILEKEFNLELMKNKTVYTTESTGKAAFPLKFTLKYDKLKLLGKDIDTNNESLEGEKLEEVSQKYNTNYQILNNFNQAN
jgi:hypothetical protein